LENGYYEIIIIYQKPTEFFITYKIYTIVPCSTRLLIYWHFTLQSIIYDKMTRLLVLQCTADKQKRSVVTSTENEPPTVVAAASRPDVPGQQLSLSDNGSRDVANTENEPPTVVAATSRGDVDGMHMSNVGGNRCVFSGKDVVNKNEAALVVASKRKNCHTVQKKRRRRSSSKAKTSAKRNKKGYYCLICAEVFVEPPTETWLQCQACHGWCHEACTDGEGPDGFMCDFCQ